MTLAATTAPTATDVRDDERRKRPVWKPLAAAGIGSAVLVATGFGVFATLQATASNTTAQEVTSGTLSLTLADNGNGFKQAVSNLAPTDTVHRFVNLTNGGTLAAKDLGVKLAATGSSTLVTDAGTTKALRVTIDECVGGSWTTTGTGGTCSGTVRTALTERALSALTGATPTTIVTGERTANAVTALRITLNLPDQNENVHNGATPAANSAASIQNQTAQLTWTFNQTQRDAVVTTS